ncbi:MAG: tRNA cyclic N6-threonylcarbamoyladenosine(37) synthase TcdA [Spirochaetae bacterium HGW-Spirochaetae-9]|nr:MAG: tRNA cyclic N6-threonylcarbamoyladenosine(37) synthase TcdA [Spirochaetae bacterium HGW-Spirochaetae-9]
MTDKHRFSDRMEILIGEAGISALAGASVSVYGLGGVGAACAMDLVRAGVGHLRVIDFDTVDLTNLNRLYFGYTSTVGIAKTEAFLRFALEVNPAVSIETEKIFFSGEDSHSIVDDKIGFHADCVDSLNAKVGLIAELCGRGLPFISSMGTAGRLAPERLKLGSIWDTSGCPLAKSVRTRLRHRGIESDFPVVWSDEPPVKPVLPAHDSIVASAATDAAAEAQVDPASPKGRRRMVQGSSPFVPQVAGHIMASWIVRRILEGSPSIPPQ